MNTTDRTIQEPLRSMGAQFQGMSLSEVSSPKVGHSGVSLAKSGSLFDNLGIQRYGSPYLGSDTRLFSSPPQPQVQVLPQVQPQFAQTPGFNKSPSSLPLDWTPQTEQRQQPGNAMGRLFDGNEHQSGAGVAAGSTGAAGAVDTPGPSFATSATGVTDSRPPGVFSLPPAQSQWKYFDTQGQVQGPFTSQSMSSWYQAGYLHATLQVCRVGLTPEPFGVNDAFIPLGVLISKVGDFVDPFSRFDLLVAQSVAQNQVPVTSTVGQAPAMSFFDQGIIQSPMEPTAVTSSLPQPTNASSSRLRSPDHSHAEILEIKDLDGGFFHEAVAQIPVHKFTEKFQDANAARIPARNVPIRSSVKPIEPIVDHDSKKGRQGVAQRVDKDLADAQELFDQRETLRRREQELRELAQREEQHHQEEQLRKVEQARREEADRVAQQLLQEQAQEAQRQLEEQETHERVRALEQGRLIEEETKKPVSPALQPAKPAPWANNAATPVARPSLADVQKREAALSASRKEQQEQQSRELASKLQQKLINENKKPVSIGSIATWASKKPASTTAVKDNKPAFKTIEQIQKEQLEEKKFVAEQKRLWEEAQRAAKLKIGTSSSSLADKENEWVTVTKKQPVANKNQASKAINQPSSYINPDKLRSVSAAAGVKQIGSSTSIPTLKNKAPSNVASTVFTGNASTSVRQEFLRWCKSQMRLSAGVDVNGVLEVLLSLPTGAESREIIADTIYSNSLSMDGKRFATEFIKRRVDCDKKVNDSLTWSEALALPEGDVDDWEFQVVGKKKNRRH
ncbi:LAMI_0E08218g1_1 [Lachancea mirantina]|uniref:LAMI_0E08218g1_1 n=1 Tax=Lachancea mirantina TaxID=1230905 RepID=A0A1G4JMT3_9SACH|nr:LAMI_0E08218g1_1 [Lachancea mirantina]